jgi:hypothetical protein
VLDVVAMNASSYVLFDNIRGKIAGEEIEAFIMSPFWEARILGESTNLKVDNVATVFLTGNQSTTSADMSDRCLFVELFVEQADNRDRVIPHVLNDSILSDDVNRAKTLSALWALVRAWDADGRPSSKTVMPRFEDWCSIVAAIVLHAGYGDPVAPPEIAGLGDMEWQEMRELVKILAIHRTVRCELCGSSPADTPQPLEWKFADIVALLVPHGLFADVEVRSGRTVEDMFDDGVITPAGKSHFGKLLGRYDRQIFSIDGRMLRFSVVGKGNTRKYVVSVEQLDRPQPF